MERIDSQFKILRHSISAQSAIAKALKYHTDLDRNTKIDTHKNITTNYDTEFNILFIEHYFCTFDIVKKETKMNIGITILMKTNRSNHSNLHIIRMLAVI